MNVYFAFLMQSKLNRRSQIFDQLKWSIQKWWCQMFCLCLKLLGRFWKLEYNKFWFYKFYYLLLQLIHNGKNKFKKKHGVFFVNNLKFSFSISANFFWESWKKKKIIWYDFILKVSFFACFIFGVIILVLFIIMRLVWFVSVFWMKVLFIFFF